MPQNKKDVDEFTLPPGGWITFIVAGFFAFGTYKGARMDDEFGVAGSLFMAFVSFCIPYAVIAVFQAIKEGNQQKDKDKKKKPK